MNGSHNQHDFFSGIDLSCKIKSEEGLVLKRNTLQKWQHAIHTYQSKLFKHASSFDVQHSLFEESRKPSINDLNPLSLTPLSLNFWRWPASSHEGPAIYLVMDKPTTLKSHLLLYIGETIASEKRWKGDHDCKNYALSYVEAFQKMIMIF